ncbi:MAG: ABC transporter permease [Actinomycetota bacterium]|nr:ABC transporter permease [Actinomycetota bacterium]
MTAALRVVPLEIFAARRPQRLIERSLMVYRRSWIIIVSGFFEPLFYLLSIRIGLSDLVGDVTYDGELVGYATFVAPALMASSAMNGAIFESTMNIYHKLKYQRLYDSVLATPMTVPDVALGEIGFSMMRGVLYSTAFVFTMWALGMVGSWWMVLSVPACALIGFAFSAIGMTATTFIRSWADFEYVPSVQIPLFLFSATFYPLSSYGDWGWIVQLSPLYHGVAIVRALNVGDVGPMMLVHAGVLFVIGVVGVAVASRRIRMLLLP